MEYLYKALEDFRFKMTIFLFIFTTFTLYIIYNSIFTYFISILSSKYIIKYKEKSPIYIFLVFFIGSKVIVYLFIQSIPYLKDIEIKGFTIFVFLN